MKTVITLLCWSVLALKSLAVAADAPWFEPTTGLRFVPVPKGCFEMGTNTPGKKPDMQRQLAPRDDERPRHRVCLDAFWLAETETTEIAWQLLQGGGDSAATSRPQVGVTWVELDAVLRRFNNKPSAEVRFRLPTEAEWEYACRAGARSRYYKTYEMSDWDALATVGWSKEVAPNAGLPYPVGNKLANPWGLYDMLGNVWEMTQDGYRVDGYRKHALYNPLVKRDSEKIVLRGGSYRSFIDQTDCSGRNYGLIDDMMHTVGFRLVVERQQNPALKVLP